MAAKLPAHRHSFSSSRLCEQSLSSVGPVPPDQQHKGKAMTPPAAWGGEGGWATPPAPSGTTLNGNIYEVFPDEYRCKVSFPWLPLLPEIGSARYQQGQASSTAQLKSTVACK